VNHKLARVVAQTWTKIKCAWGSIKTNGGVITVGKVTVRDLFHIPWTPGNALRYAGVIYKRGKAACREACVQAFHVVMKLVAF
jgi:hypothetical protein